MASDLCFLTTWFFLMLILVLVRFSIVVVPKHKEAIYISKGRFKKLLKPGMHFISPLHRELLWVNTYLQTMDLSQKELLTQDGFRIGADTIVFFRITDSMKVVFENPEYRKKLREISERVMENLFAYMPVDDILTNRYELNMRVKDEINRTAKDYGLLVEDVHVKEIKIPDDVRKVLEERWAKERVREQDSTQ